MSVQHLLKLRMASHSYPAAPPTTRPHSSPPPHQAPPPSRARGRTTTRQPGGAAGRWAGDHRASWRCRRRRCLRRGPCRSLRRSGRPSSRWSNSASSASRAPSILEQVNMTSSSVRVFMNVLGAEPPLDKSSTKFNSGCGWPAFYEGFPGAIRRTTDSDGRRTEITCATCGGRMGHMFKGEGFNTPTDERYCVNNISLKFIPASEAAAS